MRAHKYAGNTYNIYDLVYENFNCRPNKICECVQILFANPYDCILENEILSIDFDVAQKKNHL